jgi:hypothetical protein
MDSALASGNKSFCYTGAVVFAGESEHGADYNLDKSIIYSII